VTFLSFHIHEVASGDVRKLDLNKYDIVHTLIKKEKK